MFERQSKLKPAHTVRCGLVFFMGRGIYASLLYGVAPHALLFIVGRYPHTRTDFSYTRKVSKSVCKGTPLAQPRGGSRHREAVTFPPEEIFKRTLPLENAFGYFYRFTKVAAGAGCVTPQKRGVGILPHVKEGCGETSPCKKRGVGKPPHKTM